MDEREFDILADAAMAKLEQALESCGAEIDFEAKPGGVLEIDCAEGGRIIVNKHRAAREIWLAARSGGFHFKPENGRWLGTRDGGDLLTTLAHCLSEQSGRQISLG